MRKGAVTFDSNSFMVGGERIWLASGESHYFRHTADTWEDVLWRIKRAGLNAVATYVAWNRHEPLEGQFDFSGDLDLGHFLDLACEMGLYVFARPGPYICSEWTGGGLPGWLQAKENIYLREDNPAYAAAVKAYWDQLIPIIAERQVDRGGSVVLVQAENEYRQLYCKERVDYIAMLVRWLREYGITVPITGCNAHSHDGKTIVYYGEEWDDPEIIDDIILTYNTGLDGLPLEDLRKKQPDMPLYVTEQWCGGLMHWGSGVNLWPLPKDHNPGVTTMLGCGGMVNYYMFEGGTNFGHNGGQWFATGYGSAYPVGEGGTLQEKYWSSKPLNHLQQCLPEWFATSQPVDEHGWAGPEGSFLRVRESAEGQLLFWSWKGVAGQVCALNHAENGTLELHTGASPHAILPIDFSVFDRYCIEQSNASLLWLDAPSETVFLYAAAGASVRVVIDGETLEAHVAYQQPTILKSASGLTVVLLDKFLSGRFWPLEDGRICIGAYYVKGDGLPISDGGAADLRYFCNGRLEAASEKPLLRQPDRVQPLRDWQSWAASDSQSPEVWQSIDGPKTHEELGVYEGGVWYRARLDAQEEGWQNLFIPDYGAGLLSVYQNGEYVGILGESRTRERPNLMERPRDHWREQIQIYLQKGRNDFVFYSEDMGRPAGGTPAPRGLAGNVYTGARQVSPSATAEVADAPVSERAFWYLRFLDFPEAKPCPAVDLDFEVRAGEALYLCFPLPLLDLFADCFAVNTFAVEVDGEVLEPLGLPSCEMNAFDVPVPKEGGTVRVRVLYQGSRQVLLNVMKAWACPVVNQLMGWSWTAFGAPDEVPQTAADVSTTEASESRLLFPVSLDDKVETQGCRPNWYSTRFAKPGPGKHYLRIGKLDKGQIFLNGRHIGRYWQKRPAVQTLYYLPSTWMQEENELMIFEETGVLPVNVALVTKDD